MNNLKFFLDFQTKLWYIFLQLGLQRQSGRFRWRWWLLGGFLDSGKSRFAVRAVKVNLLVRMKIQRYPCFSSSELCFHSNMHSNVIFFLAWISRVRAGCVAKGPKGDTGASAKMGQKCAEIVLSKLHGRDTWAIWCFTICKNICRHAISCKYMDIYIHR